MISLSIQRKEIVYLNLLLSFRTSYSRSIAYFNRVIYHSNAIFFLQIEKWPRKYFKSFKKGNNMYIRKTCIRIFWYLFKIFSKILAILGCFEADLENYFHTLFQSSWVICSTRFFDLMVILGLAGKYGELCFKRITETLSQVSNFCRSVKFSNFKAVLCHGFLCTALIVFSDFSSAEHGILPT